MACAIIESRGPSVESLSADSSQSCSEHEIKRELEQLLASREFAHSGRLSRFLTFVVERTLAGDRDSLKESVIGTAVYDRAPGYDPKSEPIVRTEARRLRAKLDDYYRNSGRDARIRISMPTGGYVATFEPAYQPASPQLSALPEPPLVKPPLAPAKRSLRRYGVPAAAILLLMAIAGAVILRRAGDSRLPNEFVLTTVTSFPGSQYTPSVSPDGRQVVFSWADETGGSDLFQVAVDGGAPRRLTSAHAGDTLPAWSPDGTQIAFIRADKLMAVSPSGGGERAIGPGYPSWISWSPKGDMLLLSDWAPGRVLAVFAVNEATGSRRQVTFPPPGITGDTAAALSPDGATLAFVRCKIANCDIYTTPYGRTDLRRLTQDESAVAGLAWMPDGRSIVFSSNRRGPYTLWRMPASGGSPEQVASSGEDERYPRAIRGPNGKARIVFDHRIQNANIWRQRLNPEARRAEPADRPERLIASTRLDSSPQISPDGKRVVFSSDRSGYDEIWLADADGSNQRELTHMRAEAGSPRWSPDSTRIAFDLLTKDGRAIFLTDVNGSSPQRWTPWRDASRPSWSRDGRWIYFGDNDSARRRQVFKISTAPDRTIVQVTRDGGFEAFESPEGRTLYYTSDTELRAMPVSGGPWTKVASETVRAGWWSVSQNGIYFAKLPEPTSSIQHEPFPLMLLDPRSGEVRPVEVVRGTINRSTPDFTTSVDGRTLLYCLQEVLTSQIRMLDAL